jgi:hypothetical protein
MSSGVSLGSGVNPFCFSMGLVSFTVFVGICRLYIVKDYIKKKTGYSSRFPRLLFRLSSYV